jgi:hypothetical protein
MWGRDSTASEFTFQVLLLAVMTLRVNGYCLWNWKVEIRRSRDGT